MKRCAVCHSSDLRETRKSVDVVVPTASGPFRVLVSGVANVKCGNCGESFLHGPDLGRAELLAGAEAVARGLRDSQTLKFVRKALGLRAAELGMSAAGLGRQLGVPTNRVTAILHGRRSVPAARRCAWATSSETARSSG